MSTPNAADFVDGYVRVRGKFNIWFKIYRVSWLNNKSNNLSKSPIVISHGGPGMPHQYLQPSVMLNFVEDCRSVIFYDQLGCGLSDKPNVEECVYSISNSASDLNELLNYIYDNYLPLKSACTTDLTSSASTSNNILCVHLLGHSFGGMLHYEYIREYYLTHRSKICLISNILISIFNKKQTEI